MLFLHLIKASINHRLHSFSLPIEESNNKINGIYSESFFWIKCQSIQSGYTLTKISQGLNPLLTHYSIHHFMNENPATGFSVFWLINHACRTDQILEQNMFSSCAFQYHISIRLWATEIIESMNQENSFSLCCTGDYWLNEQRRHDMS